MPKTYKERVDASTRSKQIVALRHIHGELSDEWGSRYHSVINALEAALSVMEEAEAEIESEGLEA